MRKLFITRGVPGSGKSTFIKENGLEDYSISPDYFRLRLSSPTLDANGVFGIPNWNDRQVWELLFEWLEKRMSQGCLSVIDATNTTPQNWNKYRELARKYRYKIYVLDFADVALEVAKERNLQRESYKVVPEKVINRMSKQLAKCSIPKKAVVIKTADELQAELGNEISDLSEYKAVHHIGDIQGCSVPLIEYFEKFPYAEDEFYIFIGDLLDRGPDNAGVMQYVCDNFVDKENVVFVEGNHDTYIWQWITGQEIRTKEFVNRTQPQLEELDYEEYKPLFFRLMAYMREYFYYSYDDKKVFCSHGGLSRIPEQIAFLPTAELIRGSGVYNDVGTCDTSFLEHAGENSFQIHGHRNKQSFPTQFNDRCFNLEGKVEFGGELRTVLLNDEGFQVNDIENRGEAVETFPQNNEFVDKLRASQLINEKFQGNNICSFSFRRDVFYKKQWNEQTIKARGLFVNILTNELVIRSYDKFFNIGERRETEVENLVKTLNFPVKVWVKENGYLGLVGYDSASSELVISSKSTVDGPFAENFKEKFLSEFEDHLDFIKKFLSDNNCTMVFEVILHKEDPHIIEYEKDKLVLLDLIKRQPIFEPLPTDVLNEFAETIRAMPKELAICLENVEQFVKWNDEIQELNYKYNDEFIEGFVIEDSVRFMTKVKLDYYAFWKSFRPALDKAQEGKKFRMPRYVKFKPEAEAVLEYLKNSSVDELQGLSLIDFRKKYLSEIPK